MKHKIKSAKKMGKIRKQKKNLIIDHSKCNKTNQQKKTTKEKEKKTWILVRRNPSLSQTLFFSHTAINKFHFNYGFVLSLQATAMIGN